MWRDLPYDYVTLMVRGSRWPHCAAPSDQGMKTNSWLRFAVCSQENVLDSSHVPFTHHKSMSNRNVIGAYDLKLTSPLSESGFTGLWKTGEDTR